MNKKDIIKYLENSIFKPYLIHVEFEITNILAQLQIDKILSHIIALKGIFIDNLETSLKSCIETIQTLINVLTEN